MKHLLNLIINYANITELGYSFYNPAGLEISLNLITCFRFKVTTRSWLKLTRVFRTKLTTLFFFYASDTGYPCLGPPK
jgi:hypothetical protein